MKLMSNFTKKIFPEKPLRQELVLITAPPSTTYSTDMTWKSGHVGKMVLKKKYENKKIIDLAFKKVSKSRGDDLNVHFVVTHYHDKERT